MIFDMFVFVFIEARDLIKMAFEGLFVVVFIEIERLELRPCHGCHGSNLRVAHLPGEILARHFYNPARDRGREHKVSCENACDLVGDLEDDPELKDELEQIAHIQLVDQPGTAETKSDSLPSSTSQPVRQSHESLLGAGLSCW